MTLRVEIDEDSRIEEFGSRTALVGAINFDDSRFLEIVYKANRQAFFPNCPVLVRNGLRVLKDTKSEMIQAADVIGNFMVSYLFIKLGDTNRNRRIKGEIFEDVFGDVLSDQQIHENFVIAGQHDLELKNGLSFQTAI